MSALGKRIKICLLPVPVISGPTSGANLIEEIREWWIQGVRWGIGAAEVFHFFIVKHSNYSWVDFLGYGTSFVVYYWFIICSLSLSSLCDLVSVLAPVPSLESYAHSTPVEDVAFYARFACLAVLYVCFACFLVLDCKALDLIRRLKMSQQDEPVGLARNVLLWIFMLPSLIMYSCTQWWAILKIGIYGKVVCGHNPSAKDALSPFKKSNEFRV